MRLHDLAIANGGIEDPDTLLPTFRFEPPANPVKVIEALGGTLPLPSLFIGRQISLVEGKDGMVSARVPMLDTDPDRLPDWLPHGKRDREWKCKLYVVADQRPLTDRMENVDEHVRATCLPTKVLGPYYIRHVDGFWIGTPRSCAMGRCFMLDRKNPHLLLADVESHLWLLTYEPFAPVEDYARRVFNRAAPQYAYKPSETPGPHPHWDMILNHCGESLTPALKDGKVVPGIVTGGRYLLTWTAIMFRNPIARLPYLFFHGPQNSGKSSFHEALALLFAELCGRHRPGVASVDRALMADKNGELDGAVLAYCEETNVAKSPTAYGKIKDMVTNHTLWIRKCYFDAYPVPNYTHMVQCANQHDACPVEFGDTRIVVSYVPPLKNEIPKPLLFERLKEEAPNFMRTIMDLELPTLQGRLALEPVDSDDKRQVIDDTVPDIVTAVRYFAPEKWCKSAHELLEDLRAADLIGDYLPSGKAVRAQLEKYAGYLRSRGVTVELLEERNAKGKLIRIESASI